MRRPRCGGVWPGSVCELITLARARKRCLDHTRRPAEQAGVARVAVFIREHRESGEAAFVVTVVDRCRPLEELDRFNYALNRSLASRPGTQLA